MYDRAFIRNGKIVSLFAGEKGWLRDENGKKICSPVSIGYDDGRNKVVAYAERTVNESTTDDRRLQNKSAEVLVNDDSAEKVTTISDKPADEFKQISAAIQFQENMKAIKSGYSQEEIDTWPQQLAEATAYLADPDNAVTPMLTAYAEQAGLTKDALASKIIEKAEAFALAAGEALGRKKKALAIQS